MTKWCSDVLAQYLVDCGVERSVAMVIQQDVLHRAEAFAVLTDHQRDVLIAPFAEEFSDHEPRDSSLELLGATTVVVRNSALETVHAGGPVGSSGLRTITTHAVAPLSHLLAAGRRGMIAAPADNPFDRLAERYPRAWAALAALLTVVSDTGGRADFRTPDGPLPDLPTGDELVVAQPSSTNERMVVLSAIDPRFDQRLLATLRTATEEPMIVFVSALSRFSRNVDKLLRVLELLLAYNTTVLTTNYMLRSGDAWCRGGELVKPRSDDPFHGLHQQRGLSGAHRKCVANYLRSVDA